MNPQDINGCSKLLSTHLKHVVKSLAWIKRLLSRSTFENFKMCCFGYTSQLKFAFGAFYFYDNADNQYAREPKCRS